MNEISDLFKRVRKIEVITRKQVDTALGGLYSSVFKGRGIEFADLREYVPGDDVSAIDWKVTARYRKPFTKTFVEERQLNVILAVDVSRSMRIASRSPSKRELVAEISTAIGLSCLRNNDKLSLFLFSQGIDLSVLPRRGRNHLLRILREILYFEGGQSVDMRRVLRELGKILKKRSIIFFLSDFFFPMDYARELKVLNARHDVIGVVVRDDLEWRIPAGAGRIRLGNPEGDGNGVVIDTNDRRLVERINGDLEKEREALRTMFASCGVDYLEVTPATGWLRPMLAFFEKRRRRR